MMNISMNILNNSFFFPEIIHFIYKNNQTFINLINMFYFYYSIQILLFIPKMITINKNNYLY